MYIISIVPYVCVSFVRVPVSFVHVPVSSVHVTLSSVHVSGVPFERIHWNYARQCMQRNKSIKFYISQVQANMHDTHVVRRRYDMSTSVPLTKWRPNFRNILIRYFRSAENV